MHDEVLAAVRAEVEELHEFFVGWFAGTLPADSLDEVVRNRMDRGFAIVPPSGNLLTCDVLTEGLRQAYGSNPRFRIEIRDVRLRHVSDDWVLATYEEWQRHAKASTPPDNARLSTVLFGRSNPLKWLHVHETWLPREVMDACPFDF